MRKFSVFLISIFFCIVGISNAYAKDTCDYKAKNALNKIAGNVQANYEIITNAEGKQQIAINVYNIPSDDIYVDVKADGYPSGTNEIISTMIYYNQTDNGSYRFLVNDLNHIVKYTFRVRSFSCETYVRVFSIVKPMRNIYHSLDICKYQEVLDYYYCKEWLTQEIMYEPKVVIEKIENARIANTTTTTTRCYSCEMNDLEAEKKAKFEQFKMYLIIGLSGGIVLDILVIVILLIRIKRYSL